MKRLAILFVSVVLLISGCGQGKTNDNSTNHDSGYSDSAPAKILEVPEKARESARKANEKAQEAIHEME